MIDPNIALGIGQGQQSPFGGNPLQMMMQIRQMQQQGRDISQRKELQTQQLAPGQGQMAKLQGLPPAPVVNMGQPGNALQAAAQPQGVPAWMLTGMTQPQGLGGMMSQQAPAAQQAPAPQDTSWSPMQGPPTPRPSAPQHTALADAHPEYAALDQLWGQAVHAGDMSTAKQLNDVMIGLARSGQWKSQEDVANV